MTHLSHQTNGASLEDCHTNFFALTDLCGIKWRKFVNGERPNASSDPLDDPILRSYSRCMQADILCVWRRIQWTKQDNPDPNALPFEMSTSSRVHPPLSLAAAKELWIFWYGEEPDLSQLVDPELLRVAANQSWNGTWERGLTYECRSLLFKALHNLMERFVLTKDIVRFGKWFVQPCTANDRIFGRSSQHLSFSFTFFVHGDTVCASIDLREHPPVRPLTKEHLVEAAAAIAAASSPASTAGGAVGPNGTAIGGPAAGVGMTNTHTQQSHEQILAGTSPHDDVSLHDGGGDLLDGAGRSAGGAASAAGGQPVALNLRPRKVILAPFGMAGILTGNSFKASDPNAEKILDGWSSFFPLCNKDNSDIPPVVEVISGGHKMYHPSIYVLVTDLDDREELEALASQKCIHRSPASSIDSAMALASSARAAKMGMVDIKPQLPLLTPLGGGNAAAAASPLHALTKDHHLQQQQQQHHLQSNNNNNSSSHQHLKSQHHQLTNNHQQQQQLPHLPSHTLPQQQQQLVDATAALLKCGGPPYYDTLISSFSCNSANTHAPPQAATEMPERVWQDCITNPLHVAAYATAASTTATGGNATSSSSAVGGAATGGAPASAGGSATAAGNSATATGQSTAAGAAATPGGAASSGAAAASATAADDSNSNSGSQGANASMESNNNNNSVSSNNNNAAASTNAVDSKTKFWGFVDPTHKAPCICVKSQPNSAGGASGAASATTAGSNATSGHGPAGYGRNPLTGGAGDGLAVPALGSPGTPAPSPHTNSGLSQPTSVPPADQLIQMSPRAPTSVSQLQQPQTPIEHLLDKNTPAPTPTDQHDNKSITASPYVNPTPSVEAPASAEGMIGSVGGAGTGSGALMAPDSVPPPSSVGRCTPTPTLGGAGAAAAGQSQQQQQSHQQLLQDLLPTTPSGGAGGIEGVDQSGAGVKKFELPDELIAPSDIKAEPGTSVASAAGSAGMAGQANNCLRGPGGVGKVPAPAASVSEQMKEFLKLYKTPQLTVKDTDYFSADDHKYDVLYDFSVQDAWVNHPMKRIKPNDPVNSKPMKKMRLKNIYEGHTHFKPMMPSPGSGYGSQLLHIDQATSTVYGVTGGMPRLDMTHMDAAMMGGSGSVGGLSGVGLIGIASNPLGSANGGVDGSGCATGAGSNAAGIPGAYSGDGDKPLGAGGFLLEHEIKTEIMASDTASPCKEEKTNVGENFFTAEGLNPSLKDLDQIFETSSNDDCGSVIHTPPNSNNPSTGGTAGPGNTLDELTKRNTSVASAAVAAATAAASISSAAASASAAAAAAAAVAGTASLGSLGVANSGGGSSLCSLSAAAANASGATSGASTASLNSVTNPIQAEDLTKMFPTPPSHDQHHPNSSPCQMDIQMTDLSVITTTTSTTTTTVTAVDGLTGAGGAAGGQTTTTVKVKQEYSIELGSPVEEPIDDWSYVYKPPLRAILVGSSKYAPLTNLPSQMLPPLVIPPNCTYKPSWTQQQSRVAAAAAAAQQQQQQHHPPHLSGPTAGTTTTTTGLGPMTPQPQIHPHGLPGQQLQQQLQQPPQLHAAPPPHPHQQLHELLSSGPRPNPGNNMLLNQLNCPQAALTTNPGTGPTMQQLMQRAGMSPISPAAQTPGSVPFPRGSPMMPAQRQTPIHPPPPYEMAVASPATSTSSYLNKQFNSQEPPQTPQSVGMPSSHLGGNGAGGVGGGVGPVVGVGGSGAGGMAGPLGGSLGGLLCTASGPMGAMGGLRDLPEVSSLMVNLLLYDTALNVFRDHNFDSSTVCVCNADSQKVGNIRGADSGVYVPLPGSTFNPYPTSGQSVAVAGGGGVGAPGSGALGSATTVPGGNAMVGGLRMLSAFGGGNGGGGPGSALDSPASLPGAGSGNTGSSSSSSAAATPAGGNQHITGYLDEDPVDCTCGFSAVINRRLAYGAGLFYEDEMEITGIAEDPGRHKKPSLQTLIANLSLAFQAGGATGVAKAITASATTTTTTTTTSTSKALIAVGANDSGSAALQSVEQLTHSIMDLLLDQCSIIQTSSSSVHRTLQSYRRRLAKQHKQPHSQRSVANALEYVDANDIMCLALEQARLAFENTRLDLNEFSQHTLSPFHSATHPAVRRPPLHPATLGGGGSQLVARRPCAHRWPYIPVGFTRSNKDIMRTMNSIQPMLQNAFHSKSRSAAGAKDATYTVSGPLTWRQFHRLAGRASGQCEPQPIPSVIVGHEKDWISVAPLAIHYWDKFLLEPYSYARDVVYLIICPDNEHVVNNTRVYFKELSSTYEMCKLGRHTPMRGWDGLLTVGQRPPNEKWSTCLDEWLRTLEDCSLAEKIRLYANAFQNMLAPYLSRIPNDKTILLPPEQQPHGRDRSATIGPMNANMPGGAANSGVAPGSGPNVGGSGSQHMSGAGAMGSATGSAASAPTGGSTAGGGGAPMETDKSPKMESSLTNPTTTTTSSSASSDQMIDSNTDSKADVKGEAKPTIVLGDPLGMGEAAEEVNSPVIVLYVVEPFTFGSDSADLERLACVALLRCYSEMLKSIPDSVKANLNIQIISLESILELGRTRNRKRFSDEMKCLALNIFSQCRRTMVHAQPVKSLTGFGTAANMEQFLKTKDDKNRQPYRMYTPPYILAPVHEKTDKTDFSRPSAGGGRSVNEQKYSVMYCNYCISDDQSWVLASVTDDRGEMLEKVCINIDVPNRSRRRKAPARRISLKKLMDFIMGLISQTAQPWRLVIGRIGRIGHSELKSWSYLLSKPNLQKASKQLKDICKQCTLMYPPSILSACLITLEPDAKLRVMPDQFTPDERFSQISMQNPLSTPQDVSCTHILVFPTSAVCLSFTRQFNNEPQVDLDNDFLNFGPCEDENEAFNDDIMMGDLLNWDSGNLGRMSNHDSPDRMEDNRSWQSAGGSNFNSTQQQDVEEVGAINQQPLAVGYMVSTAPTGRMPAWFWAACPHVEDVCPVFLKTALHLHVPNIQTTDDILNSTNAHSSAIDHPLDSTLTADVLRYVLEGYNALSWLALDSNTHDRLSCLPIHVQMLMDLYYLVAAIA